MISYLIKFNNLPKELRDKVSSPAAMAVINALEKKYGVSLASVVMKVMIKEIAFDSLVDYFGKEFRFGGKQSAALAEELREKVFIAVEDYLGINTTPAVKPGLPVPLDEVPHYIIPPKTDKKALEKWMNERKADLAPHGSGFYFSTEDEEEVRQLAKRVAGFSSSSQKKISAEEGLKAVVKEAGINFSSEDMKKRFEQVLKTYLHGVRNRVDTKQTLLKSVEVGGLGLENAQADKILQAASKYRQEPDQPTLQSSVQASKPETSEKTAPIATEKSATPFGKRRDVDYDFGALLRGEGLEDETKKKEIPVEPKKPETPEPLYREAPLYKDEEKKEEKAGVKEEDKFIDLTKKENLQDQRTIDIARQMRASSRVAGKENGTDINIIQARSTANGDGRIKMEDVKYVPKLTGPIDELREMSILNFRRLSENPREAVLKIKKKIGFLEEESYTKRFEGIKAWRQSPVNRLYLEIGQDSIINKMSVDAIIEKRRQERKPVLSFEEFKAVMDLNKDLRY